MPITYSFAAAFLPMTFYLFIIWKMDKNEREPLMMLLLHFLWGAIGAIFLGIAGGLSLQIITSLLGFNLSEGSIIPTVFFAPVSEEIAKGVFLIWSINSRKFDNLTDGLVYGGAIGLGFGMTENFTYFLAYGITPESWYYLVIVRSLFSAVMHCIATATFGASLALKKYSQNYFSKLYPLIGLILAITIHFLWNASVSFDKTSIYGFLFMLLIIFIFFITFKLSVYSENKLIEQELVEESINGLIPSSHFKILTSQHRYRKGWIDESIRKTYMNSIIKLAFRKNQLKNSSSGNKEYFENQVTFYREKISSILEGAE